MATASVLVLRAPGINCDEETAFAWETAGATSERLHVNRLIENPTLLQGYQILTLPGGFSYGDDIAAGRILANQLSHHVGDAIGEFLDRGGLVLGICNGFQVLVRMGLLPGRDCGTVVTLTLNDSGRFEARWICVRAEISHCPFLVKGELYDLPVAHAEGKVDMASNTAGTVSLTKQGRIALRYVGRDGRLPQYPQNPNGSIENVAGLVDSTGRVFGLMPHPERHLFATQRPDENRVINPDKGETGPCDGLRIFRSALHSLA